MCVGQCIAFDSPISTTESTDEVGGVIERVFPTLTSQSLGLDALCLKIKAYNKTN